MLVPGLLRGACSRRYQQQLESPAPDARVRVTNKWRDMGRYPLKNQEGEWRRLKIVGPGESEDGERIESNEGGEEGIDGV
jgi:hypothetical protein